MRKTKLHEVVRGLATVWRVDVCFLRNCSGTVQRRDPLEDEVLGVLGSITHNPSATALSHGFERLHGFANTAGASWNEFEA